MGYWTFALIVMLVNVALIAFFMINSFKEIMTYMKVNDLGYDRYDDNRPVWLILLGILATLVSFLAWPVMVVVWGIGLLYLYLKGQDKFKRIMEIINEKPTPDEKTL